MNYTEQLKAENRKLVTRRHFFKECSVGLGSIALASLLNRNTFGYDNPQSAIRNPQLKQPHFAPKAKRVIYLFQAGGPSQIGRAHV